MLFIILGDIKVMGVEGLFRLQQSNYTQRREYHSIENQLVGEISCGSKLHLFQLKNQHLSLAEQPNCFKYTSYPLKVGEFVLGECVQILKKETPWVYLFFSPFPASQHHRYWIAPSQQEQKGFVLDLLSGANFKL